MFFESVVNTILGIGVLVFYFLPPVHVFMSPRSYGSHKFLWLVGVFLLSWVAYLTFLYATRPDKNIEEGGW